MSPEPTPASTPAVGRASAPVYHPERLVAVLGRFKVDYVLVGSLAARLHGSPLLTAIAEIVPALTPANLGALANALGHLNARLYTAAIPAGTEFEATPDSLMQSGTWDLVTSCGRLRMIYQPSGARGYETLAQNAATFAVHGDQVSVASLADLVRMHEAPPGEEVAAEGAVLRALLARAVE